MQTPVPTFEPPPAPVVTDPVPALQQLDYTGLRAVLTELLPLLVPSRFEKAQQSDPHTLQLGLRGLEGTVWLELSWLAEAPRLLAIPPPPRQGEGSTLAQQLQHGLRGLALVELQQPAWERVVELRFAARPGEGVERTLVLELMGRHSNLFLLDAERRVIALARQVRCSQSRLRPIGTGDSYQPPPAQAGEAPRRHEDVASWRQRLSLLPLPLSKALLGAYQGTSPALVRQLLDDPTLAAMPVAELEDAHWRRLWPRWQGWLLALEQRRFALTWRPGGEYSCWLLPEEREVLHPGAAGSLPDAAAPGSAPVAGSGPARADLRSEGLSSRLPINRALAAHYGGVLGQRRWRQRRQALATRLRAALEREQAQLAQQQALLDAVPAAADLQQRADALLCLPDPDRERIEEAQTLYRRARKLRRSVAAITPRLELHRQRLVGLETSLNFLEQQDNDAGLAALEEELLEQLERLRPRAAGERRGGRGRGRRRDGQPSEPSPLELRSFGGLRLQVGRNHRQNEWISLRQARRGDLWFHAQELPGSHVVLKGSEAPPGLADLQAAADLAAHFSRGRGNRRVPVVMVPTETLQRIPGADPGTVRHRGGEILWGEPERALALLQAQQAWTDAAEPSPAAAP